MNTISLPRKPQHPSRHHQAAFTIVELLIVIVVIAILAAISVVAFVNISQRANDSAIASNEAQAKKKLEVYKVDNGSYPPDQATFDSITGQKPTDKLYTTYTSTAPHDSYALSTEGYTIASALAPPTDCPSGFIPIPGNASLGTNGFCVMKYEAKNAGGNVPVSQASVTPWVNISQTNAIAYSPNTANCTGCHLITEAEWMTIAANVLSVSSNWSGGAVGSGFIYKGYSSNGSVSFQARAASSDDNLGYSGTGSSHPSNQRRTLTLSNGEVIWDAAGNVQEWTNGSITGAQPGASGSAYREYTSIGNWGNLAEVSRPGIVGAGSWNSSQGIGRLFSNGDISGVRGVSRGGYWYSGADAGILALNLGDSASVVHNSIGFRVAR